ncbi:MAG: aminotransferase class V-fold PLP-dependent enzyme [Candidatus Jettenia sp.]|uniref:cysteine desulfurase n=1 Tax=Candidatus Jettenia caeni TaxID=247490 RepID=I3IHZ7_9BACT|nr:IscS subfamily cysteine desulfurase [Candidatus Jettenia sp. AMX1]MBC6930453.1 aminotransferase class V-fold PLP-dependent enzyme [Candidatus Jettenia sp.]NUN23638.1 IscS subfamily cysteine desulfurase [Candidatus Jettenia caeni]KAA0247131.1 MAG: aminotransferase class V-fold PLP-dependent enzyme [Candidatus Jettenia sp. AMX1]MCE7882083.1 aminotransferase class V-fold PLP-dependent enzyme [Candidatus Jettenia sp. AMX1]MCQ3928603.1 aminotransferase class V-fold PLP-dependent enzyme [Candidat
MGKIYMDNASGTPMHSKVIETITQFLHKGFGNPSNLHQFGRVTNEALQEARGQVANLINAKPNEIIFTSSGTEANNFALKGLLTAHKKKGNHVITSQIEHFSVLNPLKSLEKSGYIVTYLPVDKYGMVNPADIKKAITPTTTLVSIMYANGEIGTIEPVKEIGAITKENGVLFHTDAVAAVGNIPIDVKDAHIDALSMSANQFNGPTGVGALYLREGVRILPLIEGGVQEGGRRSGTENSIGIVAMGKAAELAKQEMSERVNKVQKLRDLLREGILKNISHVYVNGHATNRMPGNLSLCIEYIEGESILLFLDMQGIAISSGSACTSRSLKASHVIMATGVDAALAQGTVLFSLGINNTEDDIACVLEKLPSIVERLRQMSPLYSQKQMKN